MKKIIFVLIFILSFSKSFSQVDSITLRIDSLHLPPLLLAFKFGLQYENLIKYSRDSLYQSLHSDFHTSQVKYPLFLLEDSVISLPPYFGKFPRVDGVYVSIPITERGDEIIIKFTKIPNIDTLKINKIFQFDNYHKDTSLIYTSYFTVKDDIFSDKAKRKKFARIIEESEFEADYPDELVLQINDRTYLAKRSIRFNRYEIWTGSGHIPRNTEKYWRKRNKRKRVQVLQSIEYKYLYKAVYIVEF